MVHPRYHPGVVTGHRACSSSRRKQTSQEVMFLPSSTHCCLPCDRCQVGHRYGATQGGPKIDKIPGMSSCGFHCKPSPAGWLSCQRCLPLLPRGQVHPAWFFLGNSEESCSLLLLTWKIPSNFGDPCLTSHGSKLCPQLQVLFCPSLPSLLHQDAGCYIKATQIELHLLTSTSKLTESCLPKMHILNSQA